MLKYVDTMVTFSEIPDEVTLCINISNCPFKCKNCHSPHLREDIGIELDLYALTNLIDKNRGITCVCIMGGDASPLSVDDIAQDIKAYYPELKVAWYSGADTIPKEIFFDNFDFIKVGHYDEDKGPINNKNTNQRMYQIIHYNNINNKIDITSKFWR